MAEIGDKLGDQCEAMLTDLSDLNVKITEVKLQVKALELATWRLYQAYTQKLRDIERGHEFHTAQNTGDAG